MVKKSNLKNNVEVHEEVQQNTNDDTTVPLCPCKAIRGQKFYENYRTWFSRPIPEWSDLSPEQKMAFCMASNGKKND